MSDNTARVISSDAPPVEPDTDIDVNSGQKQLEIPMVRSADSARRSEHSLPPGAAPPPRSGAKSGAAERTSLVLDARIARVERQNRWLRYGFLLLAVLLLWGGYDRFFPEGVTIHKTILESKELKLLDNAGNPRLFLRMYSRVPVLQLMDSKGKPRMSLGLRFDDAPFIDLSDQSGRTRATLEITKHDTPALRLFDEKGAVKFQIN